MFNRQRRKIFERYSGLPASPSFLYRKLAGNTGLGGVSAGGEVR